MSLMETSFSVADGLLMDTIGLAEEGAVVSDHRRTRKILSAENAHIRSGFRNGILTYHAVSNPSFGIAADALQVCLDASSGSSVKISQPRTQNGLDCS